LLFTIAEQIVFYPVDVIRTRVQVDTTPTRPLRAFFNSAKAFHTEGYRALYRGFWWQTIPNAPANVFYLGTYSFIKDWGLKATQHWQNKVAREVAVPMMAGAGADLACTSLYNPVDVVVQRLQLQRIPATTEPRAFATLLSLQETSTPHVRHTPSSSLPSQSAPALIAHAEGSGAGGMTIIKSMLKEEGWRGFYRGLTASTLYHLPASAMWWPSYELFKSLLESGVCKIIPREKHSITYSPGIYTVAGMMAACLTTTVLNPLNVAKTRVQTQTESYGTRNPIKVLGRIVKYEGLHALGRGVVPRLLYNVPNSALSAFIYEILLKISQKSSKKHFMLT